MNTIAVDSAHPGTVYLGGAGGGVWKTTDGGMSWSPKTDDQPSLAMGTVSVDPSGVVYAGTGDADDGGWGAGILKSTDGGDTWIQQGEGPTPVFGKAAITRIVIDQSHPNDLLAAAVSERGYPGGVFITTNGGLSWQRINTLAVSNANDLVADPSNSQIIYAAGDGTVYRSPDGGITWGPISGGSLGGPQCCRINLAISAAAPTTLLALVASNPTAMWRWTFDTKSWSHVDISTTNIFQNGLCYPPCSVDQIIAVDPTDPATIYIGGADLWLTKNGGQDSPTWADIGGYYRPETHPDVHSFTISPLNPNLVYLGNDGGIFTATPGQPCSLPPPYLCWRSLNQNLQLTQFWSIDASPTDPNGFIGAAQDNGVDLHNCNGAIGNGCGPSQDWQYTPVLGGEGGDGEWAAFDPGNPSIIYRTPSGCAPGCLGNIDRSDDGGISWTTKASGFIGVGVDKSNPGVVYAVRGSSLFRSSNYGDGGFNPLSPVFTPNGGVFSFAADGGYAYVGSNGFFASNSGAPDTFVPANCGLPSQSLIGSIAIDKTNPTRVAVANGPWWLGQSFGLSQRIFLNNHANDPNSCWQDITSNFEDTSLAGDSPVSTMVLSGNSIFVGTYQGVFMGTLDSSNSIHWTKAGTGLPGVLVLGLALTADGSLFAGTFGRGAWATFNFSISTSGPILVGLNRPGSGQVTVTIFHGPGGVVSLSCPLLLGVLCEFIPPSDSQSFTTMLTVTLISPDITNSFILTVTGTGAGIAHTTQVEVIIFGFNTPCQTSTFTGGNAVIKIFNCIPFPDLFGQIILPSGTTFPGPTVVGNAGSFAQSNFLLISGERTPYPPGKTMTISASPMARSVCIIDSPNLQTLSQDLNQAILNGVLPPCSTTNLQAFIGGAIVSEILLNCNGVPQSFPRNSQESFPVWPYQRTYTCVPINFNGSPALQITGVAYSFVMTLSQMTSVSTFFTDSSLNRLPLDPNGNPMVNVTLSSDLVKSTEPGQVLAWINVTNTSGSWLQSLKLDETLPIDWAVHPAWVPSTGAIHVYYANTTSLSTNPEITQPSTITVSDGNPELVHLAVSNFTATAIGHPLKQGESILFAVKLTYGLRGTVQSAGSYPRTYTDTASVNAWTQASYVGIDSPGMGSAFLTAYAKTVGNSGGGKDE